MKLALDLLPFEWLVSGVLSIGLQESSSDFVRKNGSSNLTQIPAYLEYCQMKDVERGTVSLHSSPRLWLHSST